MKVACICRVGQVEQVEDVMIKINQTTQMQICFMKCYDFTI